jgi:HlyD family type I secretion membrane fusion protein
MFANDHISSQVTAEAKNREGGGKTYRILILTMFVGLLALIGWAATTRLTGITRASGVVVPLMQNQVVQHLEGGIVSRLNVKEGDRVEKGQVLLNIEAVQAKSELQQILTQISAKRAALARLEAQLADSKTLEFPPDIADPAVLRNERELFIGHMKQRAEENMVFEDKALQQHIALQGLRQRLQNQLKEREIVAERVASVRRLKDLGAASQNELLQAMTAFQDVETKLDDLNHDIPQTEAALSEALREKNAAVLKNRSQDAEEKTKTLIEIAQMSEAAAALRDKTARTEVRAPVSGIINKMMVSTVGGVISPGESILEIVPESDSIAIEARLSPQDRAQIWPGTRAVIKVTAYDYSVYGGVSAEVVSISPDVQKEKEGEPYFKVRLKAPNRLDDGHPIIPGMMVNVDMTTKDYTVLEYVTSPAIAAADVALRQ